MERGDDAHLSCLDYCKLSIVYVSAKNIQINVSNSGSNIFTTFAKVVKMTIYSNVKAEGHKGCSARCSPPTSTPGLTTQCGPRRANHTVDSPVLGNYNIAFPMKKRTKPNCLQTKNSPPPSPPPPLLLFLLLHHLPTPSPPLYTVTTTINSFSSHRIYRSRDSPCS